MRYHQEKKQKNGNILTDCEIEFETDEKSIRFTGKYSKDYVKKKKKYNSISTHNFILNKDTGDMTITNTLLLVADETDVVSTVTKVNEFDFLSNFIEQGFYRGESTNGYWGINHAKEIKKYYKKIKMELDGIFTGTYLDKKDYDVPVINPLFDLLVDYHVTKKGIKVHNNIYNDIQVCYPKKKWLTLNNNKFVPAILDEFGIKTSYFITELSTNSEKVNIRTLIYIARLFGDNYVDYIKAFEWKEFLSYPLPKSKIHVCRDDSEKKSVLTVFNNCGHNKHKVTRIIYDLFEMRTFLEGIIGCPELKIKGKTFYDYEILYAKWGVVKKQSHNGYKLKYVYPDEFMTDIESPIIINDKVFQPKLLLTEEDFAIEGIIMNNCIGTQFGSGVICEFISLRLDKKRINIQYKDGKIIQSLAKANTVVPVEIFGEAISELTERMVNNKKTKPEKVKYDISDF